MSFPLKKSGDSQTQFEFATAARILFGTGALRQVGPIAAEMGRRALVVTGRTSARAGPLLDELAEHGIEYTMFHVLGEPTTTTVREATERGRNVDCHLVIGFGGGSSLDVGKAAAALLTNEGDPEDYLEVVGNGKQLTQPSAPCIAIPTTAGTGSEVTRNAVLASPSHCIKVSMRSSLMLPRVALVDPELMYDLPPEITASTGLDALTQLIEPYTSGRASPITDMLCTDGIRRVARSLARAYQDGNNVAAREDMALASLFGGLALTNAGLGVVHGFAGPIGGKFSAPHGSICAGLLPYAMEVNVAAIRQRLPASEALRRYEEIAQILTDSGTAKASDGVEWVKELCRTLRIPSLAAYGVRSGDFPELIERADRASSTKGNPIRLTKDEMLQILSRAL
jgi:alcohol dehydrogenase class IV